MRTLGRYILALSLLLIIVWLLEQSGFLGGKGSGWLSLLERQIRNAIEQPIDPVVQHLNLEQRLLAKDVQKGAPIFMRIFKQESELELWIKRGDRFELFETYPICYWSGQLGPKQKQGDKQSPEGFYTVSQSQLNPHSRFHRAFNLGYPNLFDRTHGRTGNYLMVHGACVSIGCYAMTDPVITEIWTLVTAALNQGQKRFHVHAFPFHMTDGNMWLFARSKWFPFWQDLKQGYDLFEATQLPPRIQVCNKRYQVENEINTNIHQAAVRLHCR